MLDFLQIKHKFVKQKMCNEVYPVFIIKKSKDLMIRGRDFYAFWNEDTQMWDTDILNLVSYIDTELEHYAENTNFENNIGDIYVMYVRDSESRSMQKLNEYCTKLTRDDYVQLDNKIIFADDKVTRSDYASKRLPYSMKDEPTPAYDELMHTLYDQENLDILEWCIGAIISGDSKEIQKCCVLYGESGKGKSTFLNIVQKLFEGYWHAFEAQVIGSANNQFALEDLKTNPLIAINHDGDLSGIKDNTLLNSIISHETVTVNEKHKSKYEIKFNSFLFIGTNKPVKITDAKSGIIRRLLDVTPSGRSVSKKRYDMLVSQIDFELGGIAKHCLDKYYSMGKSYYDQYIPVRMISETNEFFNFMNEMYDELKVSDECLLNDIWRKYKDYCALTDADHPLRMNQVRVELKSYFDNYYERLHEDGNHYRNLYRGFRLSKFEYKSQKQKKGLPEKNESWLNLTKRPSLLDSLYSECPAQLATEDEKPKTKWSQVLTKLKDIDTSLTHYVKIPKNHIVIDFDLKDSNGEKSFEKNLEAASKWPQTYAETSKSGNGIHLHYIWDGDPNELSAIYDKDIEVKTFSGNSSLRRKLIFCNAIQIATLSTGLPLKEKKMVDETTIKNEKHLRKLIIKNLNKEVHNSTKSSIDFIYKLLEDAYNSKMTYDVTDMRQAITYFASNSTNQSENCLKIVSKMKFKSEEEPPDAEFGEEAPIIFYDVETFPNLFLVNWKFAGEDKKCHRMINPKPNEIRNLFKYRLIGFNNRRYDNHMIYAASSLGYNNEELYRLSQRLVSADKGVNSSAFFMNAYNLSYTDIYDFSTDKKSLKAWEIELGIHHQELGLPWDEPVPEEKWEEVAEYCDNDVISTEILFNHLKADWTARQILAELSGLTVNQSTNSHTAKIIFGDDKNPKSQFVYTDLSKDFPGYVYDYGVSTYLGDTVGEGGYVYAEPGMYEDVYTFDVASMHPHSIIALNLFGDLYTKRYKDLVDTRILIKHGDYDKAKELFDGKLAKYLDDKTMAKQLAAALKIAINSVYGLTFARYDSIFKDPRNKDNIVAKRGGLFMVNLKHELQKKGIQVIHIKTDSIKIANPSKKIADFIFEYGKKWGYTFEIENIYKKFCLVNDAVYIAKTDKDEWSAVGKQFQKPYVFKKLFSKEKIEFSDMCEVFNVKKGALYLDMNEKLDKDQHDYKFVGRNGLFCPIKSGCGGGDLVVGRDNKKTGEIKYDSAANAKGYKWLETEFVQQNSLEDVIDESYYIEDVNKAIDTINKFGDIEIFTS